MNPQAANDKIPRIRWLASYPKSGNTWVRTLLYAYKYGKFNNLNQIKLDIASDSMPGVWYSASPVPWGLLNDEQKLLTRYSALLNLIMNYPNLIIKTHNANLRVNSVELIPNEISTTSVYLIRDPRDIAISFSEHLGASISDTIKKMSDTGMVLHSETENNGIYQHLGSWSTNVETWIKPRKFNHTIIKYEDLLLNPEQEFRKIVNTYNGINSINDKKIKKAIKYCQFSKLKEKEKSKGFDEASHHTEFFKRGKSGTWKDILTEEQVKKIEQDHGETMECVGYNLEYL